MKITMCEKQDLTKDARVMSSPIPLPPPNILLPKLDSKNDINDYIDLCIKYYYSIDTEQLKSPIVICDPETLHFPENLYNELMQINESGSSIYFMHVDCVFKRTANSVAYVLSKGLLPNLKIIKFSSHCNVINYNFYVLFRSAFICDIRHIDISDIVLDDSMLDDIIILTKKNTLEHIIHLSISQFSIAIEFLFEILDSSIILCSFELSYDGKIRIEFGPDLDFTKNLENKKISPKVCPHQYRNFIDSSHLYELDDNLIMDIKKGKFIEEVIELKLTSFNKDNFHDVIFLINNLAPLSVKFYIAVSIVFIVNQSDICLISDLLNCIVEYIDISSLIVSSFNDDVSCEKMYYVNVGF